MYPLYIDYFSHIKLSVRVEQKYNGADNGTKLLLLQIMDSPYIEKSEIYLILPKEYETNDKDELKILRSPYFKKMYVSSIYETDFKKDAVLFVPLVCGREMIMVNKLKKKFPDLRVYGRVHDKNHNFPFDFKDRNYFSGWKRTGLYSLIDFYGKKILFGFRFERWIGNFDKVFTVSNYSLQMLKHKNVKFINYYYQGILDYYGLDKTAINERKTVEKYLLFVNGGRPEKNSLRTIEAFSLYKRQHKDDNIKLYITSTKCDAKENLLRTLRKNPNFREDEVKFFDYISYDELTELYKNSEFLIFSSKGEGFGLPLLESLMCGRPVLASWGTSIPEVAGSSVRYVNPFDVASIANGIAYYRDEKNIKVYEEALKRRLPIIKAQIEEDAKMLIRELFEE